MKIFKKHHKKSFLGDEAANRTLCQNLEFTATEQYKRLRTNLDFTLSEGEHCAVIGVTSSIRGEGKSTTAINLAYTIATRGDHVLLIDGDLRLPTVAKKMDIAEKPGLTDFLMNRELNLSSFRSELLENWTILPSGEIPPNPSELLGSRRMEMLLNGFKEQFDYIIVDLPPVNLVSDALSISGMISGMIVVAREEYSEKKALEQCFRQLEFSNVNILGCVITDAKAESGSYKKYRSSKYKYYKNGDYRSNDAAERDLQND